MNKYAEIKKINQEEYNAFPFGFAFTESQFEEAKKKLGVTDNSELISIGSGGFIRKSDVQALDEMAERCSRRMQEAIANDPDGTGFIKDMFLYELANHEYCYTYELDDTLYALDLTYDEVQKDHRLMTGLELAKAQYFANIDNY